MRAYAIEQFGDVKGLKLVDRAEPKISARHVLVRIQAASLNYRDLVVMRGQYDRSPQLGRIPLSDGAGEVISVGSEVTRFKPGDRVAGSFFRVGSLDDFGRSFIGPRSVVRLMAYWRNLLRALGRDL